MPVHEEDRGEPRVSMFSGLLGKGGLYLNVPFTL